MTLYETLRVDVADRVGRIILIRPESMNALNTQVMNELVAAAEKLDADEGVGAIILTGSDRVFAVGADIAELAMLSGSEVHRTRYFADWSRFAAVRTPVIAAVAGYALGGGCELAMMCDLIVAADSAKFGQPEINLAVIPGMGGTQRLLRAVGYYKAADLVLTGRLIDAHEAERIGLVSRVVAANELEEQVSEIASTIAAKSRPSIWAAKTALDAALETPLAQGLALERSLFAGLFDTVDQTEGMWAFLEKRPPVFIDR